MNLRFILEWSLMFIKALDYKSNIIQIISQILALILFESHEIEIYDKDAENLPDEGEGEEEEQLNGTSNERHSTLDQTGRELSPRYARLLKINIKKRRLKKKLSKQKRLDHVLYFSSTVMPRSNQNMIKSESANVQVNKNQLGKNISNMYLSPGSKNPNRKQIARNSENLKTRLEDFSSYAKEAQHRQRIEEQYAEEDSSID